MATQMFRLTSIVSDLTKSAKTVSIASAQLRMLDVMPDERDKSDQALIVSVCSVLMLIYGIVGDPMKKTDPVTRQLYDSMIGKYTSFNNFLHRTFICSRFNLDDIVVHSHARREHVWHTARCDHWNGNGNGYGYGYGYDWISRFTCTDFLLRRVQAIDRKFDTPDWLDFVRQIKERPPAKLESYKLRYFVRSYFFLALGCSAPVVEAVDVTLFCLSKN